MFKRVRKCVLGAAFAVAAFVSICSCSDNVGLGDSVDTEAPKLEITYPPSSAVIKGSFIFAGTSSDDKGVTSMKVVV